MSKRPVVIKVGGSLLALKHLKQELQELLDGLSTHRVVLMTGGGPAVKALKSWCETANTDKASAKSKQQSWYQTPMTDEQAHWQCIKLMGDLTRTLAETFPNSVVVTSWSDAEKAWVADRLPWLVVEPFLRADHARRDHLPESWAVSSDSIAAHLAHRYRADLLLLKACELPRRAVLATTLAKRGIVDSYFPTIAKKVKHWQVQNLPGGTAPEIALDLTAPWPDEQPRRKPARAQR